MTSDASVVLTGATGFIGRRLLERMALTRRWFAVTRGDLPPADSHVTWVRHDLASDAPFTWPDGADTLVYAAQSREYRDPVAGSADMLAVNVRALVALVDAGRRAGLRRVVYLSTANVYERSSTPIDESTPVAPGSFYASTKRMAELALDGDAATLDCTVLRLNAVYGPGQQQMLIPRLIDKVERGDTVQIGPGGGLLLSPIYVDDVCEMIERLVEQPLRAGCRVFDVAGPEAVTVRDIAGAIGHTLGREPQFEVLASERRSGWASTGSRLRSTLGAGPAVMLREGLARTVAARRSSATEVGRC